jgi:hypothetical protein
MYCVRVSLKTVRLLRNLKEKGAIWPWVISIYLWFYVQDVDIRKRIELIQDFDMPALSDRIRVSKDGQYVLATGKHTGRAGTGIYLTCIFTSSTRAFPQCCGTRTIGT